MITDTDVVLKPKWRYQSSRIHVTLSDSGRHRLLLNIKTADDIKK